MAGPIATPIATAASVLAGIAFDNEIRGWLVVLVGSAVLMGSVWLVLATDLGHRLGTLVAVGGFFGWMTIMAFVWWMYGIGRAGDPPSWQVVDFVLSSEELAESPTGPVDRLADASLRGSADELVREYCPGLIEELEATFVVRVAQDDDTIAFDPPAGLPGYCNEETAELFAVNAAGIEQAARDFNGALLDTDPRKLTDEALEAAIAQDIDDETRRRAAESLSGVDSVAPELIDEAVDDGALAFATWNLVPDSEAGEAQAAADAFLTEDPAQSGFDSSADFIVINTFQKGGKEPRTPAEDGVWDRVWHEIKESATIKNPTNYSVVEVQRTLQKNTVAGEAPPFPEADSGYSPNYVVLVRDLGDRRLPSFVLMWGSLAVFLGVCWMMHRRETTLQAHLAEA